MGAVTSRRLILALALTNAALYSCLLPLWEGFDEPFHYGYIEAISAWGEIPVFDKTPLSTEIRESFSLVPLSRLLSRVFADGISFEQWRVLTPEEKKQRRQKLIALSSEARSQRSKVPNYEAQQTPLAYVLLAPFDLLLFHASLPTRILLLRLIAAASSTILLYLATCKLVEILGLDIGFRLALFACVYESQMLWASIAHVGNDFLAIPLTLAFVTWLAVVIKCGRSKDLLILAALFGAGLLAKAYFLTFGLLFAAIIIREAIRRVIPKKIVALSLALPFFIAGPWYLRNLVIYGSVSGTQQNLAGIGPLQAAAALPHIHWLTSAADFTRWSLWTGNWSFLAFSKGTLNVEAILLLTPCLLYLLWYRKVSEAELWILAGCACFLFGLIYQTCVTWVHTKGASTAPEPWYAQGILPCIWALCFRALQGSAKGADTCRQAAEERPRPLGGAPETAPVLRAFLNSGFFGRVWAALLCLISAWIAAVTYGAKLPLYYAGGFTRATLSNVLRWWTTNPSQQLRFVILGPVPLLYSLLLLFSVLLTAVTAMAVVTLFDASQRPSKHATSAAPDPRPVVTAD
jgi:hypothetical protein